MPTPSWQVSHKRRPLSRRFGRLRSLTPCLSVSVEGDPLLSKLLPGQPFVLALPIAIDNETAGFVFDAILSIGRAHNLSAYDATYIELALRNGLRLAALDTRLRNAAGAAGIVLFSAG